MARDDSISRRTVMKLAGAATATAVVAGCTGNGDDDDNGDDDNGNDTTDRLELEPGDEVVLEGVTSSWLGKEPAEIEGETNPTLVLEEGEEYTIGWDEGDGSPHNLEIVDEDDNVVDDLSTDEVTDPDEDQFLTFEATEEMAEYVCRPHPDQMRGELEIVEAENGDDENGDDENGDDENGDDDNDE